MRQHRNLTWENNIKEECSNFDVSSFADDYITDVYDFCTALNRAFHNFGCKHLNDDDANDDDDFLTTNQDCCDTLKSNYLRACMDGNNWTDTHLLTIVLILICCALVASFIEKYRIHWMPEAGGCMLVGVLCGLMVTALPGIGVSDLSFNQDFFITVLIPPIIFDASLSVSKSEFSRRVIPITMFAIVGTMISAIATGLIVHYSTQLFSSSPQLGMLDSLVFGSLISSIDPVAILSVLTSLKMGQTDTVFILVFGESLLNDGIAITMFKSLVREYNTGFEMGAAMIAKIVGTSLFICISSLLLGLLAGSLSLLYFWMLRGVISPATEVVSFFLWALVPYYVSDALALSGIVALVAMGFFMDLYIASSKVSSPLIKSLVFFSLDGNDTTCTHYTNWDEEQTAERSSIFSLLNRSEKLRLSEEADKHIRFVSHLFAHISENAIFVYLGLFLFNDHYQWNVYLVSISTFSCILSRAIMVIMVACILWFGHTISSKCTDDGQKYPVLNDTILALKNPKVLLVLVLAGLRGAVSLALVETVPIYDNVTGLGSKYKPEMKAMTCAAIMFTIFVFGGSAFYILRALDIKDESNKSISEKSHELIKPAYTTVSASCSSMS